MQVKSLRSHPYGGKYHPKGSEYNIEKAKDLKLMVVIGAVKPVDEKKQAEAQPEIPIVATPEPETISIPDNSFHQNKRGRKKKNSSFYDRKDMQADTNY